MRSENILVSKLNETFLRLSFSDISIKKEMEDHFKFRPDNYRFSPKYKQRIWDGYIRLFNSSNNTLPVGLLDRLQLFAKNNDYEIREDFTSSQQSVSENELREFIDTLNLSSNDGKNIALHQHQIDALLFSINNKRGVIGVPTGGGKSAIAYCFIRFLMYRFPSERIAIVVPTVSLIEQLFSDFVDYSQNDPSQWCLVPQTQVLGENTTTREISYLKLHAAQRGDRLVVNNQQFGNARLLLTTWQSLHALSKSKDKSSTEFFSHWTSIIGDEAHRFSASALVGVMNRLVCAQRRIGMTGTIPQDESSQMTLRGCFGPLHAFTTTKSLIEKKLLSPLRIKCLVLQYPEDVRKAMRKSNDYDVELDFITANIARHRFVINLARACKGNTLVLFQFIEKHGHKLFELAKQIIKDKPIYFISGEIPAAERERIRLEFGKQKNAILFANKQTTATGVNIPSIENVIFASPSKSKITNLQSIGRGLRLSEGKQNCVLYDIVDDASIGKYQNFAVRHFLERVKTYTAEGFEFSAKKIDL